MLFLLNRITIGSDSAMFNSLLKSGLMSKDLQSNILAPCVGTLINLSKHNSKSSDFLNTLVMDPALNMDVVSFLTQYTWFSGKIRTKQKRQLGALKMWEKELQNCIASKSAKESTIDDALLCQICFSRTMDCTFIPCAHKSCFSCISRSMMSSTQCFFCRQEITSLQKDEDEQK
eukprot:TRINITY_DN1063_c0_g1_i3.p1 TRINITY_DN1063_c0_g1~~TRINITY_DN1063_c0_g1_i3.p1  ORF type:complete len:174 (-),score=11.63 TRINITY_DN1063_c0_g1_i3:51-572(-)